MYLVIRNKYSISLIFLSCWNVLLKKKRKKKNKRWSGSEVSIHKRNMNNLLLFQKIIVCILGTQIVTVGGYACVFVFKLKQIKQMKWNLWNWVAISVSYSKHQRLFCGFMLKYLHWFYFSNVKLSIYLEDQICQDHSLSVFRWKDCRRNSCMCNCTLSITHTSNMLFTIYLRASLSVSSCCSLSTSVKVCLKLDWSREFTGHS